MSESAGFELIGADASGRLDRHGRTRALPPRRRGGGHAREGLAPRRGRDPRRRLRARLADPPAARGRRADGVARDPGRQARRRGRAAAATPPSASWARRSASRPATWEEIKVFYTSPGFSDERVWLYLAADLSDDPDAEPERGERIEIVPWPLDELDDAIAECEDSKSLIALLWLAAELAVGRRCADSA